MIHVYQASSVTGFLLFKEDSRSICIDSVKQLPFDSNPNPKTITSIMWPWQYFFFFSFASTMGNEKSTPDVNYDTTKAILIGTRTHDEKLLPFLNTRKTHGFVSNSSGAILPLKNYIHKKLYNSLDRKKLHNSKATFTPICILSKCNCSNCWSLLMPFLKCSTLIADLHF